MMLSKKIKVGFINCNSPLDRQASSGTTFQMFQALKRIGADIVWLQPKHNFVYRFVDYFYKLLAFLTRIRILRDHIIILAKIESKSLKKADIDKCDILFAPFASTALYSLKTSKPIIYLSDATFASMVDYYFKGLIPWNIKEGNKIEQTALLKSTHVIYASQWAYQSAIRDYKVDNSKVHVFEFGANIDDENLIPHQFSYN